MYQGKPQTCTRATRDSFEFYSPRKHAEVISDGGMYLTGDAGIISLPENRGRYVQLRRDKDFRSVRHRHATHPTVEGIDDPHPLTYLF